MLLTNAKSDHHGREEDEVVWSGVSCCLLILSVTTMLEKKMKYSDQEKLLLTNAECDHHGGEEEEVVWSGEVVTYQCLV